MVALPCALTVAELLFSLARSIASRIARDGPHSFSTSREPGNTQALVPSAVASRRPFNTSWNDSGSGFSRAWPILPAHHTCMPVYLRQAQASDFSPATAPQGERRQQIRLILGHPAGLMS
jgi:hypothetical protein